MTAAKPDVTHRTVAAGGTRVHVASAGSGRPVLLVHGFPETWRTFADLMTLLAGDHHVLAVDLPGFGDSDVGSRLGSGQVAAVLAGVLDELGLGRVHLVGQDVSGALTYRLAATRPDLVASWTGIETVLPGFGFEALADVAHGGAWYVGMMAAPAVPELLLAGRELAFLRDHVLLPQMHGPGAAGPRVLEEFARAYSRPGGFRGASGLYRSLLGEGQDIRTLAESELTVPVLAVSGSAGEFVPLSLRNVAPDLEHVHLPDVGHYVALEAPGRLAEVLLPFFASAERVPVPPRPDPPAAGRPRT